MDFTNFIYRNELLPEYSDKKLYLDKLKEEFIADLTNNEKYKDYFSKCEPDTIAGFILNYAERKIHLIDHYAIYLEEDAHNKFLQYREETLDKFKWIKQKKLWNLQCLWRANKIKIKEIELSWDFDFWGQNIDACPFLPEITQKEVEVLKKYLAENNIEYVWKMDDYDWQNYSQIMFSDEDGLLDSYPDFYDFYDDYFDTLKLITLPDTRGEKEMYYAHQKISKDNLERKEALKLNPPPPIDTTPKIKDIHYSVENVSKYAELFEKDPHIIELFKLWQNIGTEHVQTLDEWGIEDMNNCTELLKEADECIYMPENEDWHEAIIDCAQGFINEKIIEGLDSAFEEYKLLNELKISSGKSLDLLLEEMRSTFARTMYDPLILDGREMLGEPRDFNF